MSQFDAGKLMSEPCEDTFYDLKKDELISLAKHLKLEVKKVMRKHQIQNIVEHLVSFKVFEQTVLETVETSDSELKKLQLQLEFKKLEMQEGLRWKKSKGRKGNISDNLNEKKKKEKDKKNWKGSKKKDWKGKIS